MDFDEWYFQEGLKFDYPGEMAEAAWNHQQQRIEALEAGIKYHVKEYGHRNGCLHRVRKCSCGINKLATLLPGRGDGH